MILSPHAEEQKELHMKYSCFGCLAVILAGIGRLIYAASKAWHRFGDIYTTHF